MDSLRRCSSMLRYRTLNLASSWQNVIPLVTVQVLMSRSEKKHKIRCRIFVLQNMPSLGHVVVFFLERIC